jgi:hypothetical protein
MCPCKNIPIFSYTYLCSLLFLAASLVGCQPSALHVRAAKRMACRVERVSETQIDELTFLYEGCEKQLQMMCQQTADGRLKCKERGPSMGREVQKQSGIHFQCAWYSIKVRPTTPGHFEAEGCGKHAEYKCNVWESQAICSRID